MRQPSEIIINGVTLNEILTDHALWLQSYRKEGKHADLRYANLRGANLREADLRYADLSRANLRYADLSYANLREADLRHANLREADLREADLRYADLSHANLREAKNISAIAAAQLSIIPAGDVYGWKKCMGDRIVCLLISADVQRSNATGRKCRAESALVVSIEDSTGADDCDATSIFDDGFVYRVGEYVKVSSFDTDRWNECSSGIHFFLTREEAEAYK